jgi:hypothetical protein
LKRFKEQKKVTFTINKVHQFRKLILLMNIKYEQFSYKRILIVQIFRNDNWKMKIGWLILIRESIISINQVILSPLFTSHLYGSFLHVKIEYIFDTKSILWKNFDIITLRLKNMFKIDFFLNPLILIPKVILVSASQFEGLWSKNIIWKKLQVKSNSVINKHSVTTNSF